MLKIVILHLISQTFEILTQNNETSKNTLKWTSRYKTMEYFMEEISRVSIIKYTDL